MASSGADEELVPKKESCFSMQNCFFMVQIEKFRGYFKSRYSLAAIFILRLEQYYQ